MSKVVTIAIGVSAILVTKTVVKIVMHRNFTPTTFGGTVITEVLANGAGLTVGALVMKAIDTTTIIK